MSNKQTSVEWLFEQVCNLDWKNLQGAKKIEILEQAKAMEKEQIENAWCDGNDCISFTAKINAEQYYKEIYK